MPELDSLQKPCQLTIRMHAHCREEKQGGSKMGNQNGRENMTGATHREAHGQADGVEAQQLHAVRNSQPVLRDSVRPLPQAVHHGEPRLEAEPGIGPMRQLNSLHTVTGTPLQPTPGAANTEIGRPRFSHRQGGRANWRPGW